MTGPMKMARRLGAALGVCALASGCSTVAPYERGYLARNVMTGAAAPMTRAFERHQQVSKEAGQAGDKVGGGGCGCT